ncbi:glycerol-3-phosphate acyltransferase [Desulfococcaceae bacterium HSG9]|nr:glycerol-3-phosphate acyltransferase [Desulfococcaceae bacterium HSG9]
MLNSEFGVPSSEFLLLLIGTYLFASLNSAIVLFKLSGKSDPRAQFSQNAGTTNVYRQAGLFWAFLVLLTDVSKAVIIAVCADWLLPRQHIPWIGLAMICGNRFPCWHHFQGGKGVAHYIGFTSVAAPEVTIAALLAWILVYCVWCIPFVASIIMVCVLAVGAATSQPWNGIAGFATIITALLICYNHKRNIMELGIESVEFGIRK